MKAHLKTFQVIKRYKRFIFSLGLIAATFFLSGIFYQYHLPKLKQIALLKIEKQSQIYSPIRVWPQNIDFHLFPIGITLFEVRLLPKKSMAALMKPTTIQKVGIDLSLWALLRGQFRIGRLQIENGAIDLSLELNSIKNQNSNLTLDVLNKIPIDELVLENLNINATADRGKLVLKVAGLNAHTEARFNSFRSDLSAHRFEFKQLKSRQKLSLGLEAKFYLDKTGLYFSNLRLFKDHSDIIATGALIGKPFENKFQSIDVKAHGQMDLAEVRSAVLQYIPQLQWPFTFGNARFDSEITSEDLKNFKGVFDILTESLKIAKYELGQINLRGAVEQELLTITDSQVTNKYGSLHVDSFNLELKDSFKFNSKISSSKFDLNKFLQTILLPGIPVETRLKFSTTCEGQLKNAFNVTCDPKVEGHDFSVATGAKPNKFNIVSFPIFTASGLVNVDNNRVKYKSDLSIGQSRGESEGEISYKKGFHITYSSPSLNFQDATNLANLAPEGVVSIKGSTTGNSKTANMVLSAIGENLWLSGFQLGRAKFNIEYKQGNLLIDDITGQLGNSRYNAATNIDLRNSSIDVKAKMPFLDAPDLVAALSRKFVLPVQFSGTGSAQIDLHGPLKADALSYTLNSSLFRGSIANETYDQLEFNVISRDGFLETRKVGVTKGRSHIRVDGNIKPDGLMNIGLLARNFQIDQSENLARMKVNVTGNLNADMFLSGYIRSPSMRLLGQLSQVTVSDQPAKNSNFELKTESNKLSLVASLLGDSVLVNWQKAFTPDGASELKVSTKNWNFAQLFSIFSESTRNRGYLTNLSSELSLSVPNENPQLFSGKLDISTIEFQSGKIRMASQKPLSAIASNGLITIPYFELTGDEMFVRLKSSQTSNRELNLALDGRVDLTLATIVAPFLDDLRGVSIFSILLKGPLLHPDVTGSSFLKDGYIRFKGFPHALEQTSGDALFSQDKIIVNSMKGRIGGGQFNGNGEVQFKGINNVDVRLRAQFNDAKFNVPEGFVTRGSGDFLMRGNWFPYTVGVSYTVDSGNLEYKSSTNSKSSTEIKPSAFLPQSIGVQRLSPIVLDLDVTMARPLPLRLQISQVVDVQADISGQMKINGPPEIPILTGQIKLAKGGKITVRNNVFDIRSGLVEYNKSKPENPNLNIDSTSKITAQLKENQTRDYDIDMRVQGLASDPKITMSSEPSLPESDLISLLTLGFINESTTEEDETKTSDKFASTSYQLTSAFINEQLGINRVLQSKLGVRFDYKSSYSSEEKAEKHKFQLTKQWTPKFGTTASREIGKTTTTNVKAEYKLNKNLSAIGEWEGSEISDSAISTDTSTLKEKDQNIFGLDLQYKVDFK